MNVRKLITTAVLAATTVTAVPVAASAHDYEHRHRHHRYEGERVYYRDAPPRYYRDCRRGSGTTGLIVGGAAGALLGRPLDGGRDRTTGTVLGAGAGALLGREVARNHC